MKRSCNEEIGDTKFDGSASAADLLPYDVDIFKYILTCICGSECGLIVSNLAVFSLSGPIVEGRYLKRNAKGLDEVPLLLSP